MSNQIIGIDLGDRSTKAVCLEKSGDSFRLIGYTIQDRPAFGQPLTPELLSSHLSVVTQTLKVKTRAIIFVVGAADSLICHAEMPVIETTEMRKMVKLNPKAYFQENLSNYSFDCFVLYQDSNSKSSNKQIRKAKTLIVAAKNQLLAELQDAASTAGLQVEQVTAAQTGTANCFLVSPEAAEHSVVALVDIGFNHSTISVLVDKEITLTRVVNIGADKFTTGLAEAMSITYPVAEGLKQIMPEKVNSQLQALIAPLSNELINSIHFFEQQQDKKLSAVYVSGGSARSTFIVDILQTNLHLPCKSWNPTGALEVDLPSPQNQLLKQEAPQLTVAIGAALTYFKPELGAINLLAEQKEESELRRRDPMKRAYAIAVILAAVMMVWYALVLFQIKTAKEIATTQMDEVNSSQAAFMAVGSEVKKTTQTRAMLAALEHLSTNRFLWAPPLNSLQYLVVDNFQLVRLQINQQILLSPRPPAAARSSKPIAKPPPSILQTTFSIQAKSFAKPSAAEAFMDALAQSPWFKSKLRNEEPIRLKESQAPLLDATDPTKMVLFFTVECYAEQTL